MEIIDLSSHSTALSTSYESDVDVNFYSKLDKTEEGYTFHRENYLNNSVDRKINNYSSIYLTKQQKATDFLNITELPVINNDISFNTTIIDQNGMYLTFSANSSTPSYYFTEKTQKFIDPTDRIFEITLISGGLSAYVKHRSKDRIYFYLNNNNNHFEFISSNTKTCIYNYILDKESNKFCLSQSTKLITTSGNKLIFDEYDSIFTSKYFIVNYYLQKITPKINTSWASYNENHKNAYDIVATKSRDNLENNFLITTQYSYITGDSIKANILTLKNQKTNKNYSYRSDYMESRNDNIPVVHNRNYNGLFTGNKQETGDYGITLNYEFYNTDYKFKADQYNVFITPESLYPYKQININDLKWDERGSIGGENPYMSDKIFQKKTNMAGISGEYLCSWLFKDHKNHTKWLDRYYYPEKTSYAKALATTFNYTNVDKIESLLNATLSSSEYYDIPYVYNSTEEEVANLPQTDFHTLYGNSVFDKFSDLCLLSSSEYIYQRIGDEYVKSIIETVSKFLIQNGLNLKTINNASIFLSGSDIEETEYTFDGKNYASVQNYNDINNSHQFTISFWLQSDDWSSGFGHQIFGNLNEKGIALLDDEKITPILMIQNGKDVFTFNTDFQALDIASLNNEIIDNPNIKDIYRIDHLDSFYTINID